MTTYQIISAFALIVAAGCFVEYIKCSIGNENGMPFLAMSLVICAAVIICGALVQ